MRTDVFQDVTRPKNQFLWLLLALQGGFMNAGGFLACHRFVSHMTGYGTYVGVAAGRKNYLNAFEMAMAPLFFMAGAAYSGWLMDREMLRGREPKVGRGLVSLAVLNLVIYLAEISGYLGQFGEPLVLQRDFVLLFLLCFSCGLQNGLFTGVTKGQVRTTHLTGPTTDIGISIAKIYSLDRDDPERERLAMMNWLRVKIAIMFSGGSMIAVLIFPETGFEGFAVPCAISFFLVWYVRRLLRSENREPAAEARHQVSTGRPLDLSSVAPR